MSRKCFLITYHSIFKSGKNKKEAAALIEPDFRSNNDTGLTASNISISNLLDYVNKYFPDILLEEGRSKF